MNTTRIQIIPQYSMQEYAQEISALLAEASALDHSRSRGHDEYSAAESSPSATNISTSSRLEHRIDFFSKIFLGRPFLFGANGEGEQGEFDQSPLFRTDYFDCVTYVNTVLALALSENLKDFKKNMFKINYRNSKPAYENRHHFMSIDWNPENEKGGLIKNITHRFDIPLEMAEADIDRNAFFHHKSFSDIKQLQALSPEKETALLEKMQNLAANVAPEKSRIPYISLETLLNNPPMKKTFFEKLPLLSLPEMVRPNWDLRDKIGTNLNISHLGFLFKKEKDLIFRHATIDSHQVIELDFFSYLEKFKSSPTLKGIMVFGIL